MHITKPCSKIIPLTFQKCSVSGLCFLVAFLFLNFSNGFAQKLSGVVLDSANQQPLPFAAVVYNSAQLLGVTTDENGAFEIEDRRNINQLQISLIGYHTKVLAKNQIPAAGAMQILLKEETSVLNEVEIKAGENPALRIVRNAINARELNNPKAYNSYSFKGYAKNTLTKLKDETGSVNTLETLMAKNDTTSDAYRHLLISETVSKKYYVQPNKSSEKISGTKLSGFSKNIYAFASDDIQIFGLYDPVVKMLSEYYITPLAPGADSRYFYIPKDTVIHTLDTTFIMSYQPKFGSNFEGLKGEIHINSARWAMEYVSATPMYKGKVDFALKQRYANVNGTHWFPVMLSTTLFMEKAPVISAPGFITSKLFLDSVNVNRTIPDKVFTNFERELTDSASYVTDDFWERNRAEELGTQEVRTYARMDSIGKRYKLDFWMQATRNFYQGYFTVGQFEIKMSKLLLYNVFEGWRPGFGLYTNDLFSKRFRFGGYYGYGFGDKQHKYGGTFEYYFNRKEAHFLSFNYSYDVVQPGIVNLSYHDQNDFFINFLKRDLDYKEERTVAYNRRWAKDYSVSVGLKSFTITPFSSHAFSDDADLQNINPSNTRFDFSELFVSFKWAYREKRSANMGQEIAIGSDFPIFRINYARGVSGFLEGEYTYNKFEAGVHFKRYIKGFGLLNTTIETGLVDAPVPLSVLFSGKSAYTSKWSFATQNMFQTMRFNEFFSDQYVSFFLNHNFGPLLFRTNRFKPEVRVYQAIGFGRLDREKHVNLQAATLEKGYYESGLALNRLISFNISRYGYLGFGVGAFYRYGPNQLPVQSDNWAFKIMSVFTIK